MAVREGGGSSEGSPVWKEFHSPILHLLVMLSGRTRKPTTKTTEQCWYDKTDNIPPPSSSYPYLTPVSTPSQPQMQNERGNKWNPLIQKDVHNLSSSPSCLEKKEGLTEEGNLKEYMSAESSKSTSFSSCKKIASERTGRLHPSIHPSKLTWTFQVNQGVMVTQNAASILLYSFFIHSENVRFGT